MLLTNMKMLIKGLYVINILYIIGKLKGGNITKMMPKDFVPLVRLKVNSNGSIHLPKKVLRDKFGLDKGSEMVIGLFEILEHGEISQLPSFDVKFV